MRAISAAPGRLADHRPELKREYTRFDRSGSGACVHLMDLPQSLEGEGDTPYCVSFKQSDAGAASTAHLLARGYKSIAFSGAQLDQRVMQRLAG